MNAAMPERDAAVSIDQTFTQWMFRAYLDLGPVPREAPHHVHGLDFGVRALMEGRSYPRIQSALNRSFRDVLIRCTGLSQYDIEDPQVLPKALRTERWQSLCDHLESFHGLPSTVQVRVAWLLGKICLHNHLLALVPAPPPDDRIAKDGDSASLAYLRAYAHCRLNIDDPTQPYSIAEFEHIAGLAPPGIARIDAHYQMISQNVKNKGDLDAAEYWQDRHLKAIESSQSEIDDFTKTLVMTRFHRVGGFLPQMRRDVEGMVREMDLAEHYALALPRDTEERRIAADEMIYPVYESRTKEALWLNDLDLAEERALKTVALSPYDARAWLHLGQVYCDRDEPENALRAYRKAARLAPPGAEIAHFMAGQCMEMLDDPEGACDAYLTSLSHDPLGIAAAEALAEVSESLGYTPINRWAQSHLEDLRKRATVAPRAILEAHKSFAKPVAAE
jgi:tetratricopeptide (TPR) repeat protein